MSGFDIEAALNGLAELVRTIPAMESLTNRISAWITVGDPGEIAPRQTQVYEMPINLVVFFGYAVEGSEQAAEAMLADWLSELVRRMINNRMRTVSGNGIDVTVNLNGSVTRMDLPQAAAGVSDYTMMAGLETRTYPIAIRVIQRETIS
jgi:hypothetical protein